MSSRTARTPIGLRTLSHQFRRLVPILLSRFVLPCCLVLLGGGSLRAQIVQWEPVPNLAGRLLGMTATDSGDVFAFGAYSVFRSTDRGSSWVRANELSPSDGGFCGRYADAVATPEQNALCILDCGEVTVVGRAEEQGFTWVTMPRSERGIRRAACDGAHYYAIIDTAVYRLSFEDKSESTMLVSSPALGQSRALYAENGVLLAATRDGFIRSLDAGATWKVTRTATGSDIACIRRGRGALWAVSDAGRILRSSDTGATWTAIDAALPDYRLTSIAFARGRIVVTTDGDGIYSSADDGRSWQAATGTRSGVRYHSCVQIRDTVLALAGVEGAYRSTDGGKSWKPANRGMSCDGIQSLVADTMGGIYATLRSFWGVGESVVYSADGGTTWDDMTGSLAELGPQTLEVDRSRVMFVTTTSGALYRRTLGGSDEWRRIWTAPSSHDWMDMTAMIAERADANVVGILNDQTLYCSADGGATWDTVLRDLGLNALGWCLPDGTMFVRSRETTHCLQRKDGAWAVNAFPMSFQNFGSFAVSDDGAWWSIPDNNSGSCEADIAVSRDSGKSWTTLPDTTGWPASGSCDLLSALGGIVAVSPNGMVLTTTDGTSWNRLTSYPSAPLRIWTEAVTSAGILLVSGDYYAGDSRLFRSTTPVIQSKGQPRRTPQTARSASFEQLTSDALERIDHACETAVVYRKKCAMLDFSFFLARRCSVEVDLNDKSGARVATVILGELERGCHRERMPYDLTFKGWDMTATIRTPYDSRTVRFSEYND